MKNNWEVKEKAENGKRQEDSVRVCVRERGQRGKRRGDRKRDIKGEP